MKVNDHSVIFWKNEGIQKCLELTQRWESLYRLWFNFSYLLQRPVPDRTVMMAIDDEVS